MISILLAEDDPASQKMTLLMLKRLGYNADLVDTGLKVLQAFEHKIYDLVLMDIVMPKMDGLEATREIRKLGQIKPKVIAITAYIFPGIREKCLEAGMDGYIAKPVKLEELAEALKRFAPETK